MEQNPCLALQSLSSSDLLAATHALVRKFHGLEADLLVHLGEIDDRKLYLERGQPSMFAFCVVDLRFSDDAAYNRIMVARAGRRLPAVIDAARTGDVHLAGLRLLSPHLTLENHRAVLAEATGKSKREIELIVARLAPLPPVPATIRRVPESPVVAALLLRSRSPISPVAPAGVSGLAPDDTAAPGTPQAPLDASGQPAAGSGLRSAVPDPQRAEVKPLSETTFRVQFTAGRSLCDKLKEAQDLLRHRLPGGDMAAIFERGLDLLIAQVKKERFAIGRKARTASPNGETSAPAAPTHGPEAPASRHIPDAIKRIVYERDGGQCTFVDDSGRRCSATAFLEFEHREGFARTGEHRADAICLLCHAHNQHAADRMYGREFMDRARAKGDVPELVPGQAELQWELVPGRLEPETEELLECAGPLPDLPEWDELVPGRVELPSEDPAEDPLESAEPFPCAAPIPDPPEWDELVPGRVEGLNQEIVVSGEGRAMTICP